MVIGHRPMVPLRVLKSRISTVRIMAVPFTIRIHDAGNDSN